MVGVDGRPFIYLFFSVMPNAPTHPSTILFITSLCTDIFRDYGFIEQLPQRWIFADRKFAFDLREGQGPKDIVVSFAKNVTLSDETIAFLRKEMLRVERLKKLEEDNTDVDPYELAMTWEYADAMVQAFRLAILATPGAELDGPCDADDKACSASDGYDSLDDERDDLYFDQNDLSYFKPITCDNREIMFFNDYDLLETPQSVYQTLNYVEKKDIDDVCFDLDDVVQICSSYRPHYHEYNMDYAARYLDDVRRVVFVGGGDSMLLYETLKYPNIEKVVGLELDQKVVRNSFKYFHTQPHFDDERVEWWFGDATKSILMLPRDYFSSFDLVLIDLSETVMSLSVNKKLDVFNALALLLRPDGIMVKNELYLEKISELFDYTAQIYVPDLPIICDQVVVMGSNTVDFFRQERKDHAVGTKLLEPNEKHRLELFHDYRRTSALEEGKCDADEAESSDDNSPEGRSSILMVAEVENTTVPLKPFGGLVTRLVQVLKDGGMHPNDTTPPDDGAAATVIPMTEGHVTVRVWPDLKYCALDIHLWSSFNKMEHLRDELVKALGSDHSSLSSYRIVTGGMRGTSTWDEDHKTIGPLIEQRRNCDGVDYVREGDLNSKETHDIIMDEALGLIQRDKVSAAVLCGPSKEDCKSLEAVSRHKTINEVIAIPTCPELAAASEFSENIGDIMMECEKEILKVLRAFASSKGSISAIIVDPSAPVTMLKIASSIWSSQRNFKQLMTEDFFVLSLMPDHRDTWRKRHNLIDRVRKAIIYDPMFAAELAISSSDETMEVGILSAEDADFFLHLDDVVKNLEKRTSGLDVVVRKVQGALVIEQKNYEPRYFKKDEYDNEDALNQYATQKSFGRQTVFQFTIEDGGAPTSSAAIKKALFETITDLKYTVTEGVEMIEKGIGDGAMASAVMKEGTVVVTWDGDVRVDINLFTFDETEALATDFMTKFSKRIPKLKLLLRDNQPRGINRVVNFAQESINSEEF